MFFFYWRVKYIRSIALSLHMQSAVGGRSLRGGVSPSGTHRGNRTHSQSCILKYLHLMSAVAAAAAAALAAVHI